MNSEAITYKPSLPDPSLDEILHDFWRARIYLAGGSVLGVLFAFLLFLTTVPQYRVTMLVGPAMLSNVQNAANYMPENANFAMEYVMQNFGLRDSSDFMRFETIMRETKVATTLLQDKKFMAAIKKARRSIFPAQDIPDSGPELAAWMKKNLSINPVGQTHLKRISLLYPDAEDGIYILNALYTVTDDIIKRELIEKTSGRISYLRDTIESATNPQHREVLTKLLMDQERMKMILSSDDAVSADLAEPPSAEPKPAWPKKSVVISGFILIGMFSGYVTYLCRRNRPWQPKKP